jgi:hypothetical protein
VKLFSTLSPRNVTSSYHTDFLFDFVMEETVGASILITHFPFKAHSKMMKDGTISLFGIHNMVRRCIFLGEGSPSGQKKTNNTARMK